MTLVNALLSDTAPEGRMVRAWLDSWSVVGHVVDAPPGTTCACFKSPFVWWAEFCRDGVNPVLRWVGRAPRDAVGAVQWAALETETLAIGHDAHAQTGSGHLGGQVAGVFTLLVCPPHVFLVEHAGQIGTPSSL